ncbi:MAG: AAA family ATPase, partial [Variovorax sp.]
YWRLNVMPLMLRPLSERRQDVRALTAALMLRHLRPGQLFPWPTPRALDTLMAHSWPGNVRELDNVIQRALLLRAGPRIDAEDLAIDPTAALVTAVVAAAIEAPQRLADVAKVMQVRAIEEALAATGGHRQKAAQRLGISERTLRYRLADMRAGGTHALAA